MFEVFDIFEISLPVSCALVLLSFIKSKGNDEDGYDDQYDDDHIHP